MNTYNVLLCQDFNKSSEEKPLIEILKKEVKTFADAEFAGEPKSFAVIYGSHAYGTQTPASDVDIMFVSSDANDARMQRCIEFVKAIHANHGLVTDTEIRYEHKVLIPTSFMEEAITGKRFVNDKGEYYIPKIEKDRAFLDSIGLRQRFLNGLMAQKQIFISGDKSYYEEVKNEAQDNLVKCVAAARQVSVVDAAKLSDVLLRNGDDIGDFYLGFKETPNHAAYLNELSNTILTRLNKAGKINKVSEGYDLTPLYTSSRKPKKTLNAKL